ncbi:putative isomerase YbhE [Mycena amicta]|nr:putative isomerase YbhE [Mycena amicta]
MVKFTLYTGGYTSFIVSYLFDTQTSALTYLQTIPTSANPSWLKQHPTNPSIIYATNEVGPLGALQSYQVTPSGGLALLDEVSSGGNGPAFCAPISTDQVAIMNYGSGDGEIVPTIHGGSKFDNSSSVLVFVPDLGGDKIWRIGQVGAPGNFSIHGLIEHPKGTGPRHMAIFDSDLFVLHETANLITKQAIPSYPNGTSPFLAEATTVASDSPANATFAAAEILLPLTPEPLIYVSNRNIAGTQDPRGDTIGIFEPSDLSVVKQVYTGLVNIRGMELGIGAVGEEYLVALGAVSGGMVVYKRTEGGRNLVEVARNSSAVARTTVVMMPLVDNGVGW